MNNSFENKHNVARANHCPLLDHKALNGFTNVIFSGTNGDLRFHGFKNYENLVLGLDHVPCLTLNLPHRGKERSVYRDRIGKGV